MSDNARIRPADLRGISRIAIDGIVAITHVVEAMHGTVLRAPGLAAAPATGGTRGVTGFVYRSIRSVTGMVGQGLDRTLAGFEPLLGSRSTWSGREAALAALNGVFGDYLAASQNPLAIDMQLRHLGKPLAPERPALAAAVPQASGNLLLFVHGLCMGDEAWTRHGQDHAEALARELGCTPLFLRYNTGLHVSTNGQAFAALLEPIIAAWPVRVERLVIVGHSMGGLVARSACHYARAAGCAWPARLKSLVFLGTPHHGAPLERGGNWVDFLLGVSPYTAPFARLGKARSAGITDLRHGSLLDSDWAGRDRFAHGADGRTPVPLPRGVACYAIAASRAKHAGGATGRIVGDGLVPVASALGHHKDPALSLAFPPSRQWIAHGMNHLDLLDRVEVYARIGGWLRRPARTSAAPRTPFPA